MPLKNIALIGANGHLGPSILDALCLEPSFNVTVLTRASSSSGYPSIFVTATSVPDTLPHDALVAALRGQDALVISVAGSQVDVAKRCIDAAVEAGVSRIIPADFGSCDSTDPRTLELIPLYPSKKEVREYLVEKCRDAQEGKKSGGGGCSWTSIVNGHFLDYGLRSGLMAIDLEAKTARIFDGGDIMFSTSVLRTVGAAVVGVLLHPEQTRDQVVYVQSVATTQNELLKVVERVVGAKFRVEQCSSDEFIKEKQAVLKEKPGDHDTTEDLVSVEGIVNANWTKKENFMNALLGLPEEDLQKLVEEAIG